MPHAEVLLTLLLLLPSEQAAPARPPTGSGEGSCMASGCHAALAASKVVHGAVEAEMCEACHEYSGEGHRFTTTAEPISDACVACHDDPRAGHGLVHGAAADGDCTICHDPHGSDNAHLLVAAGAALCETCHENPASAGGTVHPPAGEGECLLCHNPHASDEPALLRENVIALCSGCHDGPAEALQLASVHEVVRRGGCTLCHDPHASPSPRLLREAGDAFCLDCHSAEAAARLPDAEGNVTLFGSRSVPAAVLEGRPVITLRDGRGHPLAGHPVEAEHDPRAPAEAFWCGSCHEPHGSAASKLIRGKSWVTLCRQCHRK